MIKPAAVFLDRDGVINRNVVNPKTNSWESPLSASSLQFACDVFPALRALRQAGYLLFIISNQPNFAKGKASFQTLESIHNSIIHTLKDAGIELSACYYCFHHPDATVAEFRGPCKCRKPSPFFIFRARDEFSLDLSRSWMIGDRSTDIECGQAAGTKTILMFNEEEGLPNIGMQARADFLVDSLGAASDVILQYTA